MGGRKEQWGPLGDTTVITEKRFASSHHAFWNSLLPQASAYVRRRNLGLERFSPPLAKRPSDNRGVINETGFRLFALAVESEEEVPRLSKNSIKACIEEATAFIQRFRSHSREVFAELEEQEIEEAIMLGSRLRDFFREKASAVVLWPEFPGCGWLDAAQGDVSFGGCLYEVKSGAGRFRGQDLRQILCYVALSHAADIPLIHSFCLVNPRTGVVLRDDVETLCSEAGGASAAEIVHEIIAYVSEPQWESTW